MIVKNNEDKTTEFLKMQDCFDLLLGEYWSEQSDSESHI